MFVCFRGRKWLIEYLREERVWETMAKLWKESIISSEVKRELYERVVIPTVVYGSETWVLSTQWRRKIEIFEMVCLKNICGYKESGQSKKLTNKRDVRV